MNAFKYLSWPGRILFGMCLSVWLLGTFWLFWPYNPITIHSLKIVNKGDIYAGSMLEYEVNYTKKKAYTVVLVTRTLINGAVMPLAPGTPTRLPIGTHTVLVKAPIPDFACSKETSFLLTAEYQVNPLRTVIVRKMSDPFPIKRHDTGQLEYLMKEVEELKAENGRAK